MTKLTLAIASLALALTAACGDNLEADPDLEREGGVIIIPQAGEALDALESAEEAGFQDPIYFEDDGYISAVGDMALAEDAIALPGIADVIPWGDFNSATWDRDTGFSLGQAVIDARADEHEDQRIDWDGNLARP